MKKLFFLIVAFCNVCYMYSEEFVIDGIKYKTNGDEVSVAGISDKNVSNVTITEKVSYRDKTYVVTKIGFGAFGGCENLTSIQLPKSIIEIEQSAFWGCSGLSRMEIPANVTTIGNCAFSECRKLEYIRIPKNVASIGGMTFLECDVLSNIDVDNENEAYCSQNGILYTRGKETIVCCPMGIQYKSQILDNVKRIGTFAFAYHKEISSLSIPENVDFIGAEAFYECSNIKELYIEDSEKEIELDSQPMYKCPINTVYMGRDRKYVDNKYGVVTRLCMGSATLEKVIFGNKTTVIGSYEFSDCANLSSVQFGDGIETIDGCAFKNCTSLQSVNLPQSLRSIAGFEGCTSLKNVVLPYGLKVIEHAAFYGSGIRAIIIPRSVESVDASSFARCAYLSKVIFDDSEAVIDDEVFYNDYNLTEIDLGQNVKSIGQSAFFSCYNLKSITFPKGLSEFGRKAFCGCRGLETIISKIEEPFEFIQDVFDDSTYDKATLYTPAGLATRYYDIYCWKLFKKIEEESPSAVDNNVVNESFDISESYNMFGIKESAQDKGLYIIKGKDGRTKKILKK